ncbi:hypothetical protein E2C01_040639 [Portunus trituberculatus]|uniref:Uncharacterized protein n=1 Tax=Portunus trituberculatus TaxID=210409 RepID=A0A5B7FNS3_PORTR|nr:hypothetical protein [Portunus trituberculatus]
MARKNQGKKCVPVLKGLNIYIDFFYRLMTRVLPATFCFYLRYSFPLLV